MQAVIDLLTSLGWKEQGTTCPRWVQLRFKRTPIFFAYRVRYVKGTRAVSIGSATTCFYKLRRKWNNDGFVRCRTSNLTKIYEVATATPVSRQRSPSFRRESFD